MMETNKASSTYPTVMTNSALHLYHAWYNTTSNKTCMYVDNQVKGGGWMLSEEHHILHGSLQVLMMQVILLNIICLCVYFVLKPLKQTKFVCSVLAGIILRSITRYTTDTKSQCTRNCPHDDTMQTLFPVEGEILMKTLSYFGMTLFIFLTAVKMDITMIWRSAKKTKLIGILSLFIPFACVLLLASRSDQLNFCPKNIPGSKSKRTNFFPILYAAGLSVTRFTNTVYAFDDMDLLTSKLGRLAMSATMIDEFFTWFILFIGTSFAKYEVGKSKYIGLRKGLLTVVYIILLVLSTTFIIRPILVLIVKKTPQGKPVKRIFILGVLVMVMVMTCVTDMLGATHTGALVLGLAVPNGPPLGSDIVHMAELFVMDYLMPLFYITIGYKVNVPTLLNFYEESHNLKIFIISVVVSSVTKFIGGFIGALASKLSGKHAVVIGLMMNIKGPMDLFLVYRWSGRMEFNERSYTVLVFAYTILTAIVTGLIDVLYKEKMSANVTSKSTRQLQTNPTNGEMRILCCIHHDQDIPIFLSFLKASNPTANSPTAAYVAHLNSLEGRAVPMISHDDRKIRRVHSNRTDQIAFEFEKYAADSNGLVTTDMYTMIAPYKSMHQDIVSLAQDENIALIVTPFHNNYAALEVNEAGGINIFTKHLLNFSPCTVGVLIDKGMSKFTAPEDDLFCNIGVLFIGGADDREAATFATRMLGNPSVNMTMVRLVVANYYSNNRNDVEETKIQMKLDQGVIHEFRMKSEKNRNVVYREIKVETIDEALNGIRTLGSAQNLILVGRQRHVANSIFDEAMLEWSKHRELGSVGDFVVSSDFQDGKTSVLVMQRYNVNEGGSHHSLHISDSNISPLK